jgi:hypothetical protein
MPTPQFPAEAVRRIEASQFRVMTDRVTHKETVLRLKTIGYWTATVLVAFPLLSGGAAQFVPQKETVEAIMRLGYPAYFVAILGFGKC